MIGFKVFRCNKNNEAPHYDSFEVSVKPGMTVLSALFHIRNNFDDSLAFRYSCRGAVCGTCAMLINNVPRLACRTQIQSLLDKEDKIILKNFPIKPQTSWDADREVLVEPLPFFPIIKDLVVNMENFFKFYRAVQPRLTPGKKIPARENLMDSLSVKGLEKYTNCVLCASCVSACPITAQDSTYVGPAALAQLYRFYIDPRDAAKERRLPLMDNKSGWWGCAFHANCAQVCPKRVPPNLAIGSARRQLKQSQQEREPAKKRRK